MNTSAVQNQGFWTVRYRSVDMLIAVLALIGYFVKKKINAKTMNASTPKSVPLSIHI
jgi:hypothetical protein